MTPNTRPPRWMEKLVRVFVNARDCDTIAGDLLEEYREVVFPARGRIRAQKWYFRQAISFIEGARFGLLLGAAFGIWNLISTWMDPLADDSNVLFTFFIPMLIAWGLAGFIATWRSGRIATGIRVGVTVALVSFFVINSANIIRVNWFLDAIRYRADWQNLVARFQASGTGNLRAFVNLEFLMEAPFHFALVPVFGAIASLIGAVAAGLGREWQADRKESRQ